MKLGRDVKYVTLYDYHCTVSSVLYNYVYDHNLFQNHE